MRRIWSGRSRVRYAVAARKPSLCLATRTVLTPRAASRGIWASATLAFWLLAAPAAQAQQQDQDTYVVVSGDTCRALSRRLFPGDKNGLDRFHDMNELGPPPHRLQPGQIVRTRPAPDARLSFVKPEVDKRLHGKPEFNPASRGDPLFRLDAVNTQKGAAAQITFRDESAMQLDEGALVVIYGSASQPLQGPARSGEVELIAGEVELTLASLRGDKASPSAMIVRTPAARVAGRPRKARIAVDGKKMSRVSVYEGDAKVAAAGSDVRVPKGFGTRVAEGEKPEKPRPLPPAPGWASAAELLKLALGGGKAAVPLRWERVQGAARYRLQLARDEGFNDRFLDATIAAPAAGAEAADVPVGRYFARVSAIDGSGLVGMPSATRAVRVAAAKVERGGPACAAPGEVKLALEDLPDLDVTLDGAPARGPLSVRRIGMHELRVSAKGEAEGATLGCEVLAPDVRIKLQRESSGALALLSMDPALPREALGVRGLEGAVAGALERTGPPGEYRAHLTAVNADERRGYGAQITWSEVPIGQAFLEPTAPAARPPPPPKAPSPIGDVLGQPTAIVSTPALFSPWLDDRSAASARLLGELRARNRSAGFLAAIEARVAGEGAAAGVSLVGRHLGDGLFSAGDATAFARFALLSAPSFSLALGLDATLPGEPGSLSSSPARFRLALSAGRASGALALFTTQAASAASHTPGWESAYGASLRLTPALSLGAQVNGFVSWGPDAPINAAFAAAAGAVYQLPQVELSASFRAGLTPDGQAAYGNAALLIGATLLILK